MDGDDSNRKWAIAIDHLTKHLVHGYIREIQRTLNIENIIPIDIWYIISIYHFEETRQKFRVKSEIVEVFEYYQPKRQLANGISDYIFEAIDKRTKKRVAIKKFKYIFDNRDKSTNLLLRELKLLLHFTKYKHPDIMRISDMIPPVNIKRFKHIYIVMPFRDVNLCKVITSTQKLTALHLKYITYQILRGLKFMHECNVYHRDIRPENIMIRGSDCDVRIINFRMSSIMQIGHNQHIQNNYAINRWYKAPEILCNSYSNYNSMTITNDERKVDSWGVGCVLFEMILRRPIFPGSGHRDQLQKIYDIMGVPGRTEMGWIRNQELRQWTMSLNGIQRKDIKMMVKEKFSWDEMDEVENCVEVIEELLRLDPGQRISAGDALGLPFFDFIRDTEEDYIKDIRGEPFDLSYERNDDMDLRKMVYYTMNEFHHRDWEKKIQRKKRKIKRREEKRKQKERKCKNKNSDNSGYSKHRQRRKRGKRRI